MKIYEWRSDLMSSDLPPSAKLVGCALAEFYRDGKDCFPSLETIAQMCGYGSRNTITSSIEFLVDEGFLFVEKRRRKGVKYTSNIYKFSGVTCSLGEQSNEQSVDQSVERSIEQSLSEHEVTEKPRSGETTKVKKKTKAKKESGKDETVKFNPEQHVTDEWARFAIEYGLNPEHVRDEYEAFCEYWTVGKGRNTKRGDWILSWKSWIRKIKPSRTNNSSRHNNDRNTQDDPWLRGLRALEREGWD